MQVNYYNDFTDAVYKNFQKYNWSGSSGFCFNEKGEVAIVWEDSKNSWNLPGGGKENSETPLETFVREVREETQCEVEMENVKFFHTVLAEVLDETGKVINDKYENVGFRFICKLKNIGEFIPRKVTGSFVSEIDAIKFVSLDELPKYIIWLESSENGKESFEKLKSII